METPVKHTFSPHLARRVLFVSRMMARIDELLNDVLGSRREIRNPAVRVPAKPAPSPAPLRRHIPETRPASLGTINLQETAVSVVSLYHQAPALAQTAERMDDHAQEQAQTLGRMVQKTDRITGTLNSVIDGLDSSATDAFSSVKLIKEITAGAKILALNASIEAARAGEAGLAFNVVALEMQRLARQTEEASEHLAGTLEAMRAKVKDVVQVVGHAGADRACAADDASSVAALAQAFHSIDERARKQQAEAHEVRELAGKTRSLSERLLMEVGKLRFGIHAKSEAVVSVLVPRIAATDAHGIEPVLTAAIDRFPFFDLFYVTDGSGRQITRNVGHDYRNPKAGEDALGKNWSRRPWYIDALKHDGPVTTDLYLSVATQRFCFTVSESIRDKDGNLLGVLGADVDFERLLMV